MEAQHDAFYDQGPLRAVYSVSVTIGDLIMPDGHSLEGIGHSGRGTAPDRCRPGERSRSCDGAGRCIGRSDTNSRECWQTVSGEGGDVLATCLIRHLAWMVQRAPHGTPQSDTNWGECVP